MIKENLALFFEDFSTDAKIISGERAGATIQGVFDLAVEDTRLGNFAYASRGGVFLAKAADVANLEGAELEIEEMAFVVALVLKDGTGMAQLSLQERRVDEI